MRRCNKNKGFSLVELLGVIVIIGIIMLIVMPSVTGIMEKSKTRTYVNDASRLVHSAKAKYEEDTTIKEPTRVQCVVFNVNELASSTLSGPNKGEYLRNYSYVTIRREGGQNIYGVQILEKFRDSNGRDEYRGIPYTELADLNNIKIEKISDASVKQQNDFISITNLQNKTKCESLITSGDSDIPIRVLTKQKVVYDYKTNGGVRVTAEEKEYSYNDPIDLDVKAEKPGYEFVGWSLTKDAEKADKNLFMQDDDITLYAIFKKTYTARFRYNNSDNKLAIKESPCTVYNNDNVCTFDLPGEVLSSTGPNDTVYSGISNTEESTDKEDEFTSLNLDYYAFYEGTYKSKYMLGANVERVSKTSDECHVTSTVKTVNGKEEYTRPNCDVTLPMMTVKSGYAKNGFSESPSGSDSSPEGETYNLKRKNTTLYATVGDVTKPYDIKLSKESGESAQSHNITVTVGDAGSGLADTISFQYGVSESNTVEPKSYMTKTINTGNAHSASFDITISNVTGSYYLWVKPASYKDAVGNSNENIKVSSGVFVLDNPGAIRLVSASSLSDRGTDVFNVNQNQIVVLGLEVTGLPGKAIYQTDFMNKNAITYIGGTEVKGVTYNYNEAENTLTLNIPETNSNLGKLSLYLPQGSVVDEYGNEAIDAKLETNLNCLSITFNITYNLNGGTPGKMLVVDEQNEEGEATKTHEEDNPVTYTSNDKSFTIGNPTKYGYEFIGWTGTGIDGNVPKDPLEIPKGSYGDRNYTANYKVSGSEITYELNGGKYYDDEGKEIPDPNPKSYTVDNEITLKNPKKEYYTFAGWTKSEEDEKPNPNYVIKKGTMGSLYLIANWTPIDYSITYDLHGGTLENKIEKYNADDNIAINGATKENASFIGWTGTDVNLPTPVVVIPLGSHGDRTYEAHYVEGQAVLDNINTQEIYEQEESTLVLDLRASEIEADHLTDKILESKVMIDGEEVDGVKISYDGLKLTLVIPETNTKTGSISVLIPGESIADNNYNFILPTSLINIAECKTITYSINYDLDGGTADNPKTYTKHDDEFTLNNPVKEGYTFAGWTGTDLTDKTMTVSIPKNSVGNKKYTANWTLNTYNINYNLDGGSVTGNPTSFTYESDEITLKNPTKKDYTFIGWTGSNGNTPQKDLKIPKKSIGERNYTANWKSEYYNVTLNRGSYISSVSGTGKYKAGTKVTISASVQGSYNDAWTGQTSNSEGNIRRRNVHTFKFNGWSGTYNSSSTTYTFTMPEKDVDLTATGKDTVTVQTQKCKKRTTVPTTIYADWTAGTYFNESIKRGWFRFDNIPGEGSQTGDVSPTTPSDNRFYIPGTGGKYLWIAYQKGVLNYGTNYTVNPDAYGGYVTFRISLNSDGSNYADKTIYCDSEGTNPVNAMELFSYEWVDTN